MKIDKISPVPPAMLSRQDPSLTLWDIWERWKTSVPPGAGEQRDVAVRRMEACIENESHPLDLRELSLSSLPPFLPPNSKLTVSENLLEGLLRHMQLDRSTDKCVADYIDNFLFYHFEDFFQGELTADNSKFLQTLFSEKGDSADEAIKRVVIEFDSERDLIRSRIREGLIAYINYSFVSAQSGDFSALKAELEILLHGEFCKTAYRCSIK
ncbi:hypothetical protein [Vagococcus sp. WN89Y]|uniref:hypothetical protein n=1 Tax=Vagococcus sp. WN89Y TaxID=3457258 RepID=UPI003FCE0262